MRVLLGKGTDLDKVDMISNLIAEKMAMSEAMADKITEGSFVSGQTILKHLLSLDKVLETLSLSQVVEGTAVPEDFMMTDGDCIGKN
jgi:hypothetical protein